MSRIYSNFIFKTKSFQYNVFMERLKIVKASKKHRDFLIESNLIIHEISEQTQKSEFAKRFDEDYFCKNPKFFCLVAEYDEIPVGMLLYSKMYWADDGEVLWVSQMYAQKEFRKFGVTSKLYLALKDSNPEAKVVSCATGKNNLRMNKILKGMGFGLIEMNFYAKKLK